MLDRIVQEEIIGLKGEIVFTPTERSLVGANAGLLFGASLSPAFPLS